MNSERILFFLCGPNEINGPNVWMTRHLPALRNRGFDCEVVYVAVDTQAPCVHRQILEKAKVVIHPFRPNRYTEDTVEDLLRLLETLAPAWVVPNYFIPGFYASALLREHGHRNVTVVHSDDPYYEDILDLFVFGDKRWKTDGIVTVSRFLGQSVDNRLRLCPGPLHKCIPYGVPLSEEMVLCRDRVQPFKVVYVGRLVERQKRILRVVDSLIRFVEESSSGTVTICGDGPERTTVLTKIAKARHSDRISFLGGLLPREVTEELRRAHAIVLLSDFEGLPIALIEAMAEGLVPIVSPFRSGLSELIQDGVNGIVVDDPDNPQCAADALLHLEQAPLLAAEMGARARQAVIDMGCSIDSCANLWAHFLEDLRKRDEQPKRNIEGLVLSRELPSIPKRRYGIEAADRRRESVLKYIYEARKLSRPVYLWGAGGGGRQFLQRFPAIKSEILAWIDSDPSKEGTMVEDLFVFSPKRLCDPNSPRPFILITSDFDREITESLQLMGYQGPQDFVMA